jgi:hypothetical protein
MSRERIVRCCREAYEYAERSKRCGDEDAKLYLHTAITKLVAALDDLAEIRTKAKILPFNKGWQKT